MNDEVRLAINDGRGKRRGGYWKMPRPRGRFILLPAGVGKWVKARWYSISGPFGPPTTIAVCLKWKERMKLKRAGWQLR